LFNWLKYLLTDLNNQWDFGLIIWQLGCILYLYRGVTATWDFQSFGLGLAGVLGAGAAMSWATAKTTTEMKKDV
jgi:hypothetical protein